MTVNFTELSAFLGVEGRKATHDPEQIEYYLPKKSGQVVLGIWPARSEVFVSIIDGDGTASFEIIFECVSVSVRNERPSKFGPRVELLMTNRGLFHIFGPPGYSCEAFI